MYFGVCLLCDDEFDLLQVIICDYIFDIYDENGKVLLFFVFGGKFMIYCKLVEYVMEKLVFYYSGIGLVWIKMCVLFGGDIDGSCEDYVVKLCCCYLFLMELLVCYYLCIYGSNMEWIFGEVMLLFDLGEDFGYEFYEVEFKYLVDYEWVCCIEDVIWCCIKEGMWLIVEQQFCIIQWLVVYVEKY